MGVARFVILIMSVLAATPSLAVEYRYCVVCDTHRARALVISASPDLGKEWYRVKTAQLFAKAYGAQSCSVSDFEPAQCGSLPEESLQYVSVTGDQVQALLSGNPIAMGQSLTEIILGIPAAIINWFKKLF